MVGYRPELVARLAWGLDEGEVPLAIHARLSLSNMAGSGGAPRMQRPLYSLRIDARGKVQFLAAAATEQSGPDGGQMRLVTVGLPDSIRTCSVAAGAADPRNSQLLDFAPDGADGVYLLELVLSDSGQTLNQLRHIDAAGRQTWTRSGPMDHHGLDLEALRGKLGYLLVHDSSLYLAPNSPQHGLARIDPSTGQASVVEGFGSDFGKLMLGADGALYASQFREVAGKQRRVVVRRALADGREQVVPTEIQLLDDLAGVDAQGNIYIRLSDGFARMSADGPLRWRQSMFGAVASSAEDVVYVCTRSEPGGLEVQVWGSADEPPATVKLSLPDDLWPTEGNVPTLVAVEAGKFHIYSGETELSAGQLLIFDAQGHLEEHTSLANDGFDKVNDRLLPIESRLGPASTLEIDRSGNAYAPLVDPEGFKILRWTSR
jgi:hypothetical protein